MRRSEVAGICEQNLKLAEGNVEILNTLSSSVGALRMKTANPTQAPVIALDAFTVAALRRHAEMIPEERGAFGAA
jgi:hypothetical protein